MSKILDLFRSKDQPAAEQRAERATGVQSTPVLASKSAPASNPETRNVRVLPLSLSPGALVFPFNEENARAAEQYRITRTKILQHLSQPRIIVISSAAPQDGKTTTAINLAAVFALKPELKILLIEADLHRSNIARLLGFPETPGLADYLIGKCSLSDALVQVEQYPNLFVLPAGSRTTDRTELLGSPAWKSLCEKIRSDFSFIIIDSPPIGLLADFDLLEAGSDGVLFVIRLDHTDRNNCRKALESLANKKLLGVIINSTQEWILNRSESYHYQGYYGEAKQFQK